MSNMPAVDKKIISVQLKLRTIAKLENMAKASGLSRNLIVNAILDDGTSHVLLTDDELNEVTDAIKQNRDARKKG